MAGIAAQLAHEYPATNTLFGAGVVGVREEMLGDIRLGLWVLACGVGCVLLIACSNVAGLLLARAPGPERGMAGRAALGGVRFPLFAPGVTETAPLAPAGLALARLVSPLAT